MSGGVYLAFTCYETEQIRSALLKEARHCAVTLGMRKTSVEQLTQAAGISKGSFYRFFDSKELLFFSVLEGIHTEVYEVARQALLESQGTAPATRAAEAILAACRKLSDTGAMRFIESDAEAILRRIPVEVKNAHYHDDEAHIYQLLQESGLAPYAEKELSAAMVRGLILTVSHQEQIGPLYPRVLEVLVRGACRELFRAD